MALNLFDFSTSVGAKLNPLGNISQQASPIQVGGATGGGIMPPTTSSRQLPQTPIVKKPSTPTVVPDRSQIDIRSRVSQNIPKLQEELKRQGVSDEDMQEILQNIVDASLQGTKQPTIGGEETTSSLSKGVDKLSTIGEPFERVGEAFEGGIAKAATNEPGWKGASGIGEAIFSPMAILDGKAAEIAGKPVELLSMGISKPLEMVGVEEDKAKDIASTIISAAPFAKGARVPLTKTSEIIRKPIDFIKDKTTSTIKKPIVAPISKIDKQISAKAADWEAPTKEAKIGVKKSTQILKRGEEMGVKPSETLVRNGILAEDNIKGGNFNTLEVAEGLRKDTIKASSDIMRPALAEASTYTPRISVGEVTNKALETLEANRGKMTTSSYESQKSLIMNEYRGLNELYPEGLTLENLHDKKIVSDVAAKYNPLGTIADNNSAAGYKILADSFRKTLEEKVPSSIPIKKFNQELAKLFQSADFLESLHGKKAPITPIKKLLSYGAKLTGATLGHGGGLAGSAAGYHIGGLLENLLVTMPSPFKKKFIENLSKTNPQIFKPMKTSIKNSKEILPENIEKSVLQWIDKDGSVHYKVIKKGELNKFNIDDSKTGIAGTKIKGKTFHLTAKTPEQMDKVGAIFEGVAKQSDVPIRKRK